MTRDPIPPPTLARTARDIVGDSGSDALEDELLVWLAGSARFRVFVEANRDKIRKKVRTAGDADALRDVRAELLAARLMLADRRVELAFEAYGTGRRGPDFTLTYRGTSTLNLEVTRLRRQPSATALATTILVKLRQLPPSVPNALVVAIDADGADGGDLSTATQSLRARADAKDEGFFARAGFAGSRGFFDRYLRLGAVIAWCERGTGDGRAALWTNASARIALPERAALACVACLRAGVEVTPRRPGR